MLWVYTFKERDKRWVRPASHKCIALPGYRSSDAANISFASGKSFSIFKKNKKNKKKRKNKNGYIGVIEWEQKMANERNTLAKKVKLVVRALPHL